MAQYLFINLSSAPIDDISARIFEEYEVITPSQHSLPHLHWVSHDSVYKLINSLSINTDTTNPVVILDNNVPSHVFRVFERVCCTIQENEVCDFFSIIQGFDPSLSPFHHALLRLRYCESFSVDRSFFFRPQLLNDKTSLSTLIYEDFERVDSMVTNDLPLSFSQFGTIQVGLDTYFINNFQPSSCFRYLYELLIEYSHITTD